MQSPRWAIRITASNSLGFSGVGMPSLLVMSFALTDRGTASGMGTGSGIDKPPDSDCFEEEGCEGVGAVVDGIES